MFPSTCGFSPQLYNSSPALRHPIASLHSQHQPSHLFSTSGYGFNGQQSYDALHRLGLTLQPQPMTSIPAADSSRAFSIILNSDEQKCILGIMMNMRLISDSTTKELSPHHVQLLNTTFANKKKRLDCFNDKQNKT
jgi:hypothetical protein